MLVVRPTVDLLTRGASSRARPRQASASARRPSGASLVLKVVMAVFAPGAAPVVSPMVDKLKEELKVAVPAHKELIGEAAKRLASGDLEGALKALDTLMKMSTSMEPAANEEEKEPEPDET
jgi:hypothetical protein